MLVEVAGAAVCIYGIYYVIGVYNGRYKYKRKWHDIMTGADIKNASAETYKVLRTVPNPKNDGCFMEVSMPPGLSFNKLKECEHILESGFNAEVKIEWNRDSGNAEIAIKNKS